MENFREKFREARSWVKFPTTGCEGFFVLTEARRTWKRYRISFEYLRSNINRKKIQIVTKIECNWENSSETFEFSESFYKQTTKPKNSNFRTVSWVIIFSCQTNSFTVRQREGFPSSSRTLSFPLATYHALKWFYLIQFSATSFDIYSKFFRKVFACESSLSFSELSLETMSIIIVALSSQQLMTA